MASSEKIKNSALFLDRDGVINYDYGYVHEVKHFKFYPGIFSLAKLAFQQGYKIVVVTNQAGIGRGFYSEDCFRKISDWMCNKFKNKGVIIDKVYFSPYHPTKGIGKYKRDHFFRKPKPGMLLQAQRDLNLNLSNSIMIGDKLSDIQAAISAGVQKNFLFSSDKMIAKNDSYQVINDFEEVADFILNNKSI
jgi:D-glycero-D-manno-heptose 1,7-bisphosphate phosphatase